MSRAINKKELDILEQRGLWKAASFLSKKTKKLRLKNLPLEIGFIKQAHSMIFETAKQPEIAGKYRRENGPELKRIDGSILKIADWKQIPNEMAQLDSELRIKTSQLPTLKTGDDLYQIIQVAAKLSHRLASIHPFSNGNGRSSRLLLNAILQRADLPEIAIKKSKNMYLWAMRHADDGNFETLENIIIVSLIEISRKMSEEIKKAQYRTIHDKNRFRKNK